LKNAVPQAVILDQSDFSGRHSEIVGVSIVGIAPDSHCLPMDELLLLQSVSGV